MADMIDRVARALCTHHYEKIVGGSIAKHVHMLCNVEQNWPRFVDPAKAAIKAMREPSDHMVVDGDEQIIAHLNDKNRFLKTNETPASDSWRAMIDAALAPETIERSER